MNQLKFNMKLLVIMALLLSGVGCSHEQSSIETASPIVQQNKQDYSLETTSLVVYYDPGQVLLTTSDKNNISALIEKA